MQRQELTLPGTASSVPPARHFVERALEAWDLAAVGWTAALVVTELAANAALHAGTEFTVAVSADGEKVRLEVHDRSSHLPRRRNHSAEATTGRGLRLVAELAQDWGVQPALDGKSVWVELSTAASGFDDGGGDSTTALLDAFSDDTDTPDVEGHTRAMARAAA